MGSIVGSKSTTNIFVGTASRRHFSSSSSSSTGICTMIVRRGGWSGGRGYVRVGVGMWFIDLLGTRVLGCDILIKSNSDRSHGSGGSLWSVGRTIDGGGEGRVCR